MEGLKNMKEKKWISSFIATSLVHHTEVDVVDKYQKENIQGLSFIKIRYRDENQKLVNL